MTDAARHELGKTRVYASWIYNASMSHLMTFASISFNLRMPIGTISTNLPIRSLIICTHQEASCREEKTH